MKKYPLWKTSLVVPQKAENRTTTSPSNFQTKTYATGTSLVVQCFQDSVLPMQETQFWSLVKELRSYLPYAARCGQKRNTTFIVALVDIWGQKLLCCLGDSPVFTSIFSLYHLDSSSTPKVMKTKSISSQCQMTHI